MVGKTADEIIAAVGPPTSIGRLAGGKTLLQWQATGCQMALLFGPNGRLIKITHEYANYATAPSGDMAGTAVMALVLVILATVVAFATRC